MSPSSSSIHSNYHSFSIQKRKYFFRNFLDSDKDGIVRWKDLELLISNIEEKARKDEFIRSKMSLIALWHVITDYHEEKDEICEDEWLSIWKERKEDKCQLMEDHIFNLFDPSGDGLIDESEYIHVLSFFGISKDEALRSFDYIGRTSNGDPVFAIDSKRFSSLWKEFFYSDDISVDGSYLFGIDWIHKI